MKYDLNKLAYNILNYSLKVEANHSVYIKALVEAKPLVIALIEEAGLMNVNCFTELIDEEVLALQILNNSEESAIMKALWDKQVKTDTDAVIYIMPENHYEMQIGQEKYAHYQKIQRQYTKLEVAKNPLRST
ncbi:MAG: hypothetical protein ACRCTA_06640, partial [Bacilli bacterium]